MSLFYCHLFKLAKTYSILFGFSKYTQLEMHHLKHKNEFSPDKVVAKALEVGNTVLFPR
jgi:hypothetical protein